MSERKLTESEVERRIERGHPASVIARLFAVSMAKRLRWDAQRAEWPLFNAVSGKFSPVSEFVVGAMIGAFVITTGKIALGGSSDEMDRALQQPDWASIEQAARVLLTPGSKFLTAPTEAPMPAQPQTTRKGMAHVPAAPPGARRRLSGAAVR